MERFDEVVRAAAQEVRNVVETEFDKMRATAEEHRRTVEAAERVLESTRKELELERESLQAEKATLETERLRLAECAAQLEAERKKAETAISEQGAASASNERMVDLLKRSMGSEPSLKVRRGAVSHGDRFKLHRTLDEELMTPSMPSSAGGDYLRTMQFFGLDDLDRSSKAGNAWNTYDKDDVIDVVGSVVTSMEFTPGFIHLIRAARGYISGKHYWEVKTLRGGWYGGRAHLLGVATQEEPRTTAQNSAHHFFWGIAMGGALCMEGTLYKVHLDVEPIEPGFECQHGSGTIYGLLLDMDHGRLSVTVDGNDCGVIYSGLRGMRLFPAMGLGTQLAGFAYEAVFDLDPSKRR